MRLFILAAMMFMHVVADFNLQHLLATWKQKQWWKDNCPGEMYQNDWKICLELHAFSWAFMVMLPEYLYMLFLSAVVDKEFVGVIFFIIMIVNTLIHIRVDHEKCNRHKINLSTDQHIHTLQVVMTCTLCNFIIAACS